MELSFIKTNPTGNTTVLIETPVARSEQPEIAARLMSQGSVGGEQVGFLEPASQPGYRLRLQMMGGEFCGNAAMSLAAVLAEREGIQQDEMLLEVSGCDTPVHCAVERRNGEWFGTVDMPLPEQIGELHGFPAVFFPGIIHLIAPTERFTDEEAGAFVRSLCRETGSEALGLMLFRERDCFMRPCVYVAGPDSVTWEHGCASGTAALGAWYGAVRALRELPVSQPGGIITAHSHMEGNRLSSLSITGRVAITARGTAYL